MKFMIRICLSIVILLLVLETKTAFAVSFLDLGELTGGYNESFPTDVSADGTVVVGQSNSELGNEAFRWTANTGIVGLGFGDPTLTSSFARAVSADGMVITGDRTDHDGVEAAFSWTLATGFSDIVGFGGPTSATDVSSNGQVIVGSSTYPPVNCPLGAAFCEAEAFRWNSAEGTVGVGDLDTNSIDSVSTGVSSDGSIIVGSGTNLAGDLEAFRWTSQTGIEGLGDLPGGVSRSYARAISADGKVIVGLANSASGPEAFRWTQETGMVGLGDFFGGGYSSMAVDVNADGSVIVGNATTFDGQVPFIWDQQKGMRLLSDVLIEAGVSFDDWSLVRAAAISSDGKTIVGSGWSPLGSTGAWLIQLDSTPGDATYDNQVDAEDLTTLLSQYGQTNLDNVLTADFDKDGSVTLDDLLTLKKNSTTGGVPAATATQAVPEPSTVVYALFSIACLFAYRRKKLR